MKLNELKILDDIGNQVKRWPVKHYEFDINFWKNATESDIVDILKYFEISLKPLSGNPVISNKKGYWEVSGKGDVDLSNQDLKSIPIVFGDVIKGNFNVSHNNLISLKNCPYSSYNFNCSFNKLQSLSQGVQEFIGAAQFKHIDNPKAEINRGIYNCESNNLKSLFGMVERCMMLICKNNPGKFVPEDTMGDRTRYRIDKPEVVGNVVWKFIGDTGTFTMSDYWSGFNKIEYANSRKNREFVKECIIENRHQQTCETLGIEYIPLEKIRERELNSTMNDVFGVCRQYQLSPLTEFKNAMEYKDVQIINQDKSKYFDKITESTNLGNILYSNNHLTIGRVFNCDNSEDLLYVKINETSNFFYWKL